MVATFPVFDSVRNLFIEHTSGIPAAQPCGDCPEWSIYGVCWRESGCGVTPCEVDVNLYKNDSTALNRSDCGIHKFIYTATRLNQLVWGPFASPLTGTVSVEFTIDGVSVKGPTSQNVVETIEYSDAYTWENPSYFASGWHSCKAFVTWEGTKEGVGQTTIREMYAACVYAGIRPSGEYELALHDVVILPGSGNEVCISETLRAVKVLGPYRAWADADYVRTTWWTTIDPYVRLCLCPNTCASGEVDLDGGVNSDFPPGNTVLAPGNYLGFTGCTPSIYPIYVQFRATFVEPGGCNFYMKFYDAEENEISETEIFDATDYDFVVPPCTIVKFVVVNSNEDPAYCQIGYSLGYYSNYPDPDAQEECPFESTITDLVPSNADELKAHLAEIE